MTTNTEAGSAPVFTLADRLRKSREMKGLNKIEFAERIGISRNSVNRYEAGKGIPRRPTLVSWALATGVPLEWLQTGRYQPDGPGTDWYPAPWLSNVA